MTFWVASSCQRCLKLGAMAVAQGPFFIRIWFWAKEDWVKRFSEAWIRMETTTTLFSSGVFSHHDCLPTLQGWDQERSNNAQPKKYKKSFLFSWFKFSRSSILASGFWLKGFGGFRKEMEKGGLCRLWDDRNCTKPSRAWLVLFLIKGWGWLSGSYD